MTIRCRPSSMTLMGGPIDTRINPTAVNQLAKDRPLEWFRDNVVMPVPLPQPGFMRPVYPGFLQLSGFMSMNLDRHMIGDTRTSSSISSRTTATPPKSTAISTTNIWRSWI